LASAVGERAGDRRFFCVVIPLLFETHAENEMDTTICVACSSATQRQRLAARGWTTEQISQRIKSQLPIEEKMERADVVIWNEGPLEILASQIDRLLRRRPHKHY
jgi:dephospho-CoA kinase